MAFNKTFTIENKTVGLGCPVYFVAEIGRNHNADIELAKTMIDKAGESGADSVKFQSFRASELLIKELPKVSHIKETSDEHKTAFELTEAVELKFDDHVVLKEYAEEKKLTFFSTPEDHNMVNLLSKLKIPVFKIASLDIVYLDLVESIAETKCPIILSTGMSYLGEIEKALLILEKKGVNNVILLHCTSNYPPEYEDINLNVIPTLKRCFDLPIGYSDHSLGIGVSIAAVALGACLIERHFTIDKSLPGPDQRLSLVADEFKKMVDEIRNVEKALGSHVKRPVSSEMVMRKLHRRRLVAAKDLKQGDSLTRDDIACKCSEYGLEPEFLSFLIGRNLKQAIKKDSPFHFSIV